MSSIKRSKSPQHLKVTDVLEAPSSPTSIHSSSSAIFERDIEPLVVQTNHHRNARSKTTEQLEQAVPSVLDSAASALASMDSEPISVISPISLTSSLESGLGLFSSPTSSRQGRTSGFSSPNYRSRSPSPLGVKSLLSPTSATKGALLLSIPNSNTSPPRPPSIITPPHHDLVFSSTSSRISKPSLSPTSPTSSLPNPHPHTSSTSPTQSHPTLSPSPSLSQLPSPSNANPHGHAHSPTSPQKRLSFISYADLLTSQPQTTQPLTSLTTSISTSDAPPHIPSVSGGLTALSNAGSRVGSRLGSRVGSRVPSRAGSKAPSPFGSPKSGMVSLRPDSVVIVDGVGEWEREGLGKGLEERLEEVGL